MVTYLPFREGRILLILLNTYALGNITQEIIPTAPFEFDAPALPLAFPLLFAFAGHEAEATEHRIQPCFLFQVFEPFIVVASPCFDGVNLMPQRFDFLGAHVILHL